MSTEGADYAERLRRLQGVWWKRILPVQAPYRWNIRRQRLGRTLEVGCGIGRNLAALNPGSIGVDHNADSIAMARALGHEAMTTGEFRRSVVSAPGAFEGSSSLMCSNTSTGPGPNAYWRTTCRR